jgi:hypothetical protein
MGWYDKLFIVAFSVVIITIQVIWQRTLIKANRKIKHGLHAFYYLLADAALVWIFWPEWWQVILLSLITRLAFFDPALNIARGKPLAYNGAGGSIQDRLENRLSVVWVRTLKIIYIVLFALAFTIIK